MLLARKLTLWALGSVVALAGWAGCAKAGPAGPGTRRPKRVLPDGGQTETTKRDGRPHLADGSAATDGVVRYVDGRVSLSDGSTAATTTPGVAPPAFPLEDPSGKALAVFFRALSDLERGRILRVRVSHWGDSHVAGSVMTAQLRQRLQKRFGDAGPGFVLLGRPWRTYRHGAARQGVDKRWRAERLWSRYSKRRPKPRDDLFGLAGISVHTRRSKSAWVMPRRGRIDGLDLYYLRQPGGGRADLYVDGRLRRRVLTLGSQLQAGFFKLELRRPARRVDLRAAGGEVRLYGIDLWRKRRGLVYDAFGINGARVDAHLKWNAALIAQQLARLSPQLVVLAYGSNEVDAAIAPKTLEARYDNVVQRLRRALPRAACLIVGPPDQARRSRGQPFALSDRLAAIITGQRRVARKRGCAFWSQQKAMGGAGGVFGWVSASPPLARRDHVHLYGRGYRRLADALYDALVGAYRAHQRRAKGPAAKGPAANGPAAKGPVAKGPAAKVR